MKKRFISLLISLSVLLTIFIPSVSFAQEKDVQLAFDDNGLFQILILADIQDIARPQKATLAFLEAAIDEADPDLIVLLGDNIYGPGVGSNENAVHKAISSFADIIVSRHIPFAVVFGNHDDEKCISKEAQMSYYQTFEGCLLHDDAELSGCGNYCLLIYGADNTPEYKLWFFDSGTYDTKTGGKYAYVETDQIEWYENKCAEIENDFGKLPALAFQHIIVPEIFDTLIETTSDAEDAISYNDTYIVPDPSLLISGGVYEKPCPPDHNNGQFESWLKTNDIRAAFFGHDHTNDFEIDCQGIALTASPSIGFFSYGSLERHGARVVTIDENTLDYTTYLIRFDDVVKDVKPGFFVSLYGAQLTGYAVLAFTLVVIIAVGIIVFVKHLKKRKKQNSLSVRNERCL